MRLKSLGTLKYAIVSLKDGEINLKMAVDDKYVSILRLFDSYMKVWVENLQGVREKGKRYKVVNCSGRRGNSVDILAKTRKRVSAVSKVWEQPKYIRVEHVQNDKAGMAVRKGAKLGSAKIGKNHVFADSVEKMLLPGNGENLVMMVVEG